MNLYLPEGRRYNPNKQFDENEIARLSATGEVAESICILSDSARNMHIRLGECVGIIPQGESGLLSLTGLTDYTLSRAGKPVCFTVIGFLEDKRILLSRKSAQQQCVDEYISRLQLGDIIPARITGIKSYGVFADIGCGIYALLPIDYMSMSCISSPTERFKYNQDIFAAVKSIENGSDPKFPGGKITLTHRELLGTWEENAAYFTSGQTVPAIVRSVEEFGAFVELTPNLTGLTDNNNGFEKNALVSVYIKAINPKRMKVKLCQSRDEYPNATYDGRTYRYMKNRGRIRDFNYSPYDAEKQITTVFY
ncbi:MAG: S1 RNA-binding domain-containing protein [Oscillospiraceae bacterium]|jgi:small subunit ribosomal protein S1|nr:S1 RNA-binding domain-containing protein [Oscillospiraceae bacterium]